MSAAKKVEPFRKILEIRIAEAERVHGFFCACQKLSRESKSKNRARPVGRNAPIDRQTPEIIVGSLHQLVRI